jgi:hypothetical protein
MTASGDGATRRGQGFEPEYLYDDEEDPSAVTIFTPASSRRTTEWITARTSVVVPFEEIH